MCNITMIFGGDKGKKLYDLFLNKKHRPVFLCILEIKQQNT
jgi:hypothetical protein